MTEEVVRVVDFEELHEPEGEEFFYVVKGEKDHKLSLRTLKKLLNKDSEVNPTHEW